MPFSAKGNDVPGGYPAADDAYSAQEREPAGAFLGLQGGLVHLAPDGEVGHRQAATATNLTS